MTTVTTENETSEVFPTFVFENTNTNEGVIPKRLAVFDTVFRTRDE